jgi:hypothetical protein
MGVRKVLESCLGCVQRSKIMIFGYTSTKRLRTPELDHFAFMKYVFLSSLLNGHNLTFQYVDVINLTTFIPN